MEVMQCCENSQVAKCFFFFEKINKNIFESHFFFTIFEDQFFIYIYIYIF